MQEGRKTQLTTLRLKREACEPARSTLRRLHLSIAKRLGYAAHGGSLYLRSKGKDHDCQHTESPSNEPSVWVRESSSMTEAEDHEELPAPRPFNLGSNFQTTSTPSRAKEEINSANLWQELADFEESRLYFGIHSSGPLLPLVVDACPPTILSVEVFESFHSRLYVGVPIVISPYIIHATHGFVAWFLDDVDGSRRCVSSAYFPASGVCPSYTPVIEDLGKFVSVLVVPMRPGHNRKGCEDAYQFCHAIEELPPMPIVSPIREAWTVRSSDGIRQKSPNLRVITYNLLADWYAGRTVEACGLSQKHTLQMETTDGRTSPSESSSSNHNKSSKRTHSFYNYCGGEFLMRNRRFPMILAEILSYQPDIVCLQEVDSSIFDLLLMPALRSKGYQGFFSSKTLMQSEGCAMFWSLQVFEEADAHDMHEFPLRDFVKEGHTKGVDWEKEDIGWEECSASIQHLMASNPPLNEMMTSKLGQVVQIASLHPRRNISGGQKKPKALVVGNTHLFYHPMADHIRAIQAFQACRFLDAIRREASQGTYSIPLILCGDLNSNPLSGAVHLLLQGKLGPEHSETWKHLHEYTWDMGGEEYLMEHGYIGNSPEDGDDDPTYVNESFEDASEGEPESWKEGSSEMSSNEPEGLRLQFPSTFPRLISGYPELPAFTNYSVGFAETFDYILVSEPSQREQSGFRPVDAAPIPSSEDMRRYGPMPNEFMPSDHVSLVCDLAWTDHDEEE